MNDAVVEIGQENPFQTSEKFSEFIEELVWEHDITYTEALSSVVEKHQIDYDKVKGMVSPALLDKIMKEVSDANIIRKGKSKTQDVSEILFG